MNKLMQLGGFLLQRKVVHKVHKASEIKYTSLLSGRRSDSEYKEGNFVSPESRTRIQVFKPLVMSDQIKV